MYTLLVIAIYSLVILIFVPLDNIAKVQTTVRKKWKQLLEKLNT